MTEATSMPSWPAVSVMRWRTVGSHGASAGLCAASSTQRSSAPRMSPACPRASAR